MNSSHQTNLVNREHREGIVLLTVNRPDAKNAINAEVRSELTAHLDEIESQESVVAVIITGAGDEAFVAGADIKELAQRKPKDGLTAELQRLYDRIENFRIPTIAAVNGYAFGGGFELALACDIRVAGKNAQFALPETSLGIIPAAGGTQRLTRIAGRGLALDIVLTGRRVLGEEAISLGIATYFSEQPVEKAWEIAKRISRRAPFSNEIAKQVVKHGEDINQATGMLLERMGQSIMYASPESAEGTGAFIEKRRPDYTDLRNQNL